MNEKRQGNTGVWTFVAADPNGKVLAKAEWGTNYWFNREQWEQLPIKK